MGPYDLFILFNFVPFLADLTLYVFSTSGGGSMVGAISGSTQREPLVVGKPSTFMMDYLSNKYG